MKRYWSVLAARIDDMTLRQRAMLFATVSLLVVFLAHALFIEPVLARQKQLIERMNRDQSQLKAVREQIEVLVKGEQQPAFRELEARVAAAEKALAKRKEAFVAPTRLPALLKDFLRPGQPLRMEALRIVPGAPVEGASGFYRHGVELTLKGSYFDLVQYLAELEKLRSRLLWGATALEVEKYPDVRLTLQVHTLSTQPYLGL